MRTPTRRLLKQISKYLLASMLVVPSLAHATTFYVDASSGNDTNPGTEVSLAWASLAPVNAHKFAADDRILFHAGQTWTGVLEPHGSGTAVQPIVLASYGDGAKPLIQGAGADATLVLRSVSGWTVQDIAIANHGAKVANRVGVLIHTNGFSFAIHLLRVDISDVNGEVDSKSSGGISVYAWDKSKEGSGELARFDDVLIDHCTISHVDGEGIFYYLKNEGRTYPDTNIRITGTTITDTGRNAIYMRGTMGGMIDHNIVRLAGARKHGNAICVGWAKNTIVRANEVSETGIHTGPHENGAIDVDDGAIGTLVEFNWTHDNVGGAVNAGAQPGADADDSDTIIRYNLSENDGERAFGIGGAISNTSIYNNTIYVGKGKSTEIVSAGQYTHYPELPRGITFVRNVIFNRGSASFALDGYRFLIDGNCYLGNPPKDAPHDAHAVEDKTQIRLVEAPIHDRIQAAQYRLPPGSACANPSAGPQDPGSADFLGTPLDSANSQLRGAIVPSPRAVVSSSHE
jgi:hypothetical protein